MQKLRRYGGKIERCSALLDSARPGAQQRWAQRRDVGQLRERLGTGERVGNRVGNRYRQDIEYRPQPVEQIGDMDVMTAEFPPINGNEAIPDRQNGGEPGREK